MMFVNLLLTLVVLFHSSVESRRCYICSCEYDWGTNSGSCASPTFLSGCNSTEVGNQLCFIISSYDGNAERRVFEFVRPDTFEDPHFIQAVETITLSGTVWTSAAISSISYGCDWDGCNEMRLAQFLPDSFQMRIDQTVLNSQLIDGQLTPETCLDCSKCINDLVGIACKVVSCPTGVCFIDEVHNFIVTPSNNCTYNFFGLCDSFSNPLPKPNARVRATYYIDFPAARQLEVEEVDIICTKDNCNSIVTVETLKQNLETTIVIPPEFQPNRLNSTSTTPAPGATSTTTAPGATSTTPAPGTTSTTPATGATSTTTAPGATSTTPAPGVTTTSKSTPAISPRSYIVSFLCLIPILLLL